MTILFSAPSSPAPAPSICVRNSDFTRRLASCSPDAPRLVQSESISSMKMVAGADCRAIANSARTYTACAPSRNTVRETMRVTKWETQ
jgi:hypothetical protein